MSRLGRLAAAVLLSACALAPVAQADGDPASDVLISTNVFFSYTKLPEPSKAALNRAVEQANAGATRFASR
jgi:ABC-type sugar transport system substrate-binding protein